MAAKPMPKPPGGPRKTTIAVRDNVLEVFERIGGIFAMTKWAQENQDAFYTQIFTKIIPREVAGKLEVEHREVKTLDAEEINERARKYLERRAAPPVDPVQH